MREYRTFKELDIVKLSSYLDRETTGNYILKSIDTYHTYEMYLFIVRDFPEKHDFMYGSSLIKPIFSLIPREIWAEKPENLTNTLPRLYYRKNRGAEYSTGMTVIGEFYINLGIIGVIVLSFLWGYISGYFAKLTQSEKSRFNYLVSFIYIAVFPSLMRGGINTTIILFCISVGFTFFVLLFLKNFFSVLNDPIIIND